MSEMIPNIEIDTEKGSLKVNLSAKELLKRLLIYA